VRALEILRKAGPNGEDVETYVEVRRLIRFHDEGPDGQGRRRFALFWIGRDHFRLGRLAAQEFHARPEQYADAEPLTLAAGETDADAACRALGVERAA
jgi:hypothetical protein